MKYLKKKKSIMVSLSFLIALSACSTQGSSEPSQTVKSEVIEEESEPLKNIETAELSTEVSDIEVSEDQSGGESEYIFPTSDENIIYPMEIGIKSAEDLRLGRNEIYARHGRKFSSEDLQSYFDSKEWYVGTIEPEDFDESLLSEVERNNIKVIKMLEDIPELPSTEGPRKYQFYMLVIFDGEMQSTKEWEDTTETLTVQGDTLILHTESVNHYVSPPQPYEYEEEYYKTEYPYWMPIEMNEDSQPLCFDDAKLIIGGWAGDAYSVYKRIE